MTFLDSVEKVMDLKLAGFSLGSLLSALLLLAVCLIAVKLVLRLVDGLLARMKVDKTLLSMLRSVIRALLLFLVLLIVMGYLGIPVTSLVAVLSVLGLAVSLGIQNFLTNVAGGCQLLVSHPFRVGDYVEAGGCEGTVQEIGLFYTKVLTVDNKLVQLPNSTVVAVNITNFTHEPRRRVDIKVSAAYECPIQQVRASLEKAIARQEGVLQDPAPVARVSAYLDSSIEYVVRVWCQTEDYWTIYFDLLEDIKLCFDQDGIQMSYPHMNVHIQNEP